MMKLSDFNYDLPTEYIAQTPIEPRDASRLMVLDRTSGTIDHRHFYDIADFLHAGDVLVLNTTRVVPARLHARKMKTKGAVEILLLHKIDDLHWRGLVGGRRLVPGIHLMFDQTPELTAEIVETHEESERTLRFNQPIEPWLEQIGTTPLPPYIGGSITDPERYQTIYNQQPGSAAAPTAGLHFTAELLLKLRAKGVQFAHCVLHIGLDTFQPVKVENILDHQMHSERAFLSADDAKIINQAKLAGGRIIAVGTTAARTLETAGILSEGGDPEHPNAPLDACPWRPVIAIDTDTKLFIYPGYRWRILDGIITNFHLPRSTLLMMISAFTGHESLFNAYAIAKQENYRFFSFGDAMFIH